MMSAKRKSVQFVQETGRAKKKQKMDAARTIAVQPSQPSNPQIPIAGSSRVAPPGSLPSAIDVERFSESRAYEINAMENAMKTASASSTQRAWQALPRHLRRRAASHDVRRVPLRLRDKAQAEMDPAKKKANGKFIPKQGKGKRVKRTDALLKRQLDKTWLETHVWHAKRMKMENMWGYRLAVHPTEKSFRSSHRASIHGSILHDASYQSLIELKGSHDILSSILKMCCDPQDVSPGVTRYSSGSRVLETRIYEPGSYPYQLIAPATIMWRPIEAAAPELPTDLAPTSLATQNKSKRSKKKGEGTAPLPVATTPENISLERLVWIRSHPATFDQMFSCLKNASSLVLEAHRRILDLAETNVAEVEIVDLRGQVNIYEIMGPKSNQVIKGALKPVAPRPELSQLWASLKDLQSSASLCRGTVAGFKVNDPRLSFPPSNAKPTIDATSASSTPVFASAALAQSEIWDETTRASLKKPRYKKSDLDERRSKHLIPGTPLHPLRQDDRIPVVIIQRSLENTYSNQSQGIHGWTMIIPAGWSMPFFSSLIFTGTRVGGQRECSNQTFEAGCPYFPRDFPFTESFEEYSQQREIEDRTTWEKKPPAKRANFDALGTRSPWKADWDVILGLRTIEADGNAELVTTQREATDMLTPELSAQRLRPVVKPWLFTGSEVDVILGSVSMSAEPAENLLGHLNRLRASRSHPPLDVAAEDLFQGGVVMVELSMLGKGSLDEMSIIYSLEDEEVTRWHVSHKNGRQVPVEVDDSSEEERLSTAPANQENIIGYVSCGNQSLSRGQGYGIGAISISSYLRLMKQSSRLSYPSVSRGASIIVKVRDRDGHVCRAASLTLIVKKK